MSRIIAESSPVTHPVRGLLHAMNPAAISAALWQHRDLVAQLTRREIEGRYKGSLLGVFWSFITPVVMLAVYVFVFGVVFKARWPNVRGGDSLSGFALIMFAGQIAFQLFGEPVGRAANLITAVPNFVKRVVFPLHIIPLTVVAAAAFHAAIAILALLIAEWAINGALPWTIICLPLAALPLALLALGVTWFLSALGVYMRDVGFIVGVALQALFFATPIFYPASAVPEVYRQWLSFNPVAPGVELVRACLITGELPAWPTWLVAYLLGSTALVLGHAWFSTTRKGFADVV